MKIPLPEQLLLNLILFTDRAYITHGYPRGFLHHVTHLTSQVNLPFSGHHVYLDLQGVAAHTRPGQAAHDTDLIFLRDLILLIPGLAQILFQIIRSNHDLISQLRFFLSCMAFLLRRRLLSSLQNMPRLLPTYSPYLPLQAAHSCFSRIAADDGIKHFVGKTYLFLPDSVLIHFLLYQMFPGDMKFLIGRVAIDLDQLHTVEKRPRNGVRAVRRSDKQYL